MRKEKLVLGGFAALLVALAPAGAIFSAPKIYLEAPNKDVGVVEANTIINETFIVKNTGDAELVIKSITPSCGCTVVNIDSSAIAPGSEASIDVKVDLAGKKGHLSSYLNLITNDPENPKYTVTLKGKINQSVTFEPEVLNLGSLSRGMSVKSQVVVKVAEDMKVTSVELQKPREDISVELVKSSSPNSYIVELKTKPPMSAGKIDNAVALATNNPKSPKVFLPIVGSVSDKYAVSPSEIVLLKPKSSEPAQNSITRYVTIRKLESDAEKLRVEAVTLSCDGKYELVNVSDDVVRIKLTGLTPAAAANGKEVTVKINDAKKPTIVIPVKVIDSESVNKEKKSE